MLNLRSAIRQLGLSPDEKIWIISHNGKEIPKALPKVRELKEEELEKECLEVKKVTGIYTFTI